MLLQGISFWLVTLSFCLSAGWVWASDDSPKPVFSPELLKEAKLAAVWQSKLALNSGERLDRLFALGQNLYILTDRNYLFCLDRKNGSLRFGKSLAPAGLSVFLPQLFRDRLLITVGNTLLELSTESGEQLTSKRIGFTVSCPAVRNATRRYVAGIDKRLHVFIAKDGFEDFQVAADNDSLMTSIVVTDEFGVFSTVQGNLISILADRPVRRWQFDAARSITAGLVLDGNELFVSSRDTNLYKLSSQNGRLLWKFYTGDELTESAGVTKEFVYQPAGYKGLYAVNRQTGQMVWQVEDGVAFLAEADGKAYVITGRAGLVVMDNKTGGELYRVNFAGLSRYLPNSTDSLMYFADEAGQIECIKPLKY